MFWIFLEAHGVIYSTLGEQKNKMYSYSKSKHCHNICFFLNDKMSGAFQMG